MIPSLHWVTPVCDIMTLLSETHLQWLIDYGPCSLSFWNRRVFRSASLCTREEVIHQPRGCGTAPDDLYDAWTSRTLITPWSISSAGPCSLVAAVLMSAPQNESQLSPSPLTDRHRSCQSLSAHRVHPSASPPRILRGPRGSPITIQE